MDEELIIGEIYYEDNDLTPLIKHIDNILKENGIKVMNKIGSMNSVLIIKNSDILKIMEESNG